jgi:hypothetical protein
MNPYGRDGTHGASSSLFAVPPPRGALFTTAPARSAAAASFRAPAPASSSSSPQHLATALDRAVPLMYLAVLIAATPWIQRRDEKISLGAFMRAHAWLFITCACASVVGLFLVAHCVLRQGDPFINHAPRLVFIAGLPLLPIWIASAVVAPRETAQRWSHALLGVFVTGYVIAVAASSIRSKSK